MGGSCSFAMFTKIIDLLCHVHSRHIIHKVPREPWILHQAVVTIVKRYAPLPADTAVSLRVVVFGSGVGCVVGVGGVLGGADTNVSLEVKS